MSDRIRGRLQDALVAAKYIQSWIEPSRRDDLDQDVMLQSAVLLQLERIGEALRAVRSQNESIDEAFPEVHGWIAMRHIISHAYREIDLDAIWFTCTEEIPELIRALEDFLS